MTVYSMTAYASIQSPVASSTDLSSSAHIGIELRSVNSRFLDLNFKLSEELRALESSLRELLSKRLKRGKIELRAFVMESSATSPFISVPSEMALQRLRQSQEQIQAWLPNAAALCVADVLRLALPPAPSTDYANVVLPLAQQVIDDLIAARQREGERLAIMLRERTTELSALATQAGTLLPGLLQEQQQRYLDRFHQALQLATPPSGAPANPTEPRSAQYAQERALTEAAAFAIRIDVAEEVTRLQAHLQEINDLIGSASPSDSSPTRAPSTSPEIGKRLDFIIQELHREANTLGSKSSTLALSRISIDMKVLIEQMREQVQNIE